MSTAKTLNRAIFSNYIWLALIPIFVIALLMNLWLVPLINERVAEHNYRVSLVIQKQIEQQLLAPSLALDAVLFELKAEELHHQQHIRQLMEQQLDRLGVLDSICVIDKKSEIKILGLPQEYRVLRTKAVGSQVSNMPFIERARNSQKPQWSKVHSSPFSQQPTLSLALPFDQQLIIGSLRLSQLAKFLRDQDLKFGTHSLLIDATGEVLVRGVGFDNESPESIEAALRQRNRQNDWGQNWEFTHGGTAYIGNQQPLSDMGWIVAVAQPTTSAYRVIQATQYILIVTVLIAVVVAVIVGGFMSKKLSRPIEKFVAAADQIKAGHYSLTSSRASIVELQKLSESFESMAGTLAKREIGLRESQQQLEVQNQFYQTLLDTIPVPIFYKDREGRYLGFNAAFEKFNGSKREQLIGKTVFDIASVHIAKTYFEKDQELFENPGQQIYEWKMPNQQGELREVILSKATFNNAEGEVAGIVGAIYDITDRKEAEQQTAQMQQYLANVFDSMPSLLFSIDHQYRLVRWNRETELFLGLDHSKLKGGPLSLITDCLPVEQCLLDKAFDTEEVQILRRQPFDNGDKSGFVDITIYPMTVHEGQEAVIRIDNVSEQVNMEDMMVQSEKMLSVGGLAAGMAHEINNPLAGILQNCQVVLNRISPDFNKNIETAESIGLDMEKLDAYMQARSLPKMLNTVMESGQRAADIIENMLSFSRKSSSDFIPENLAGLLDRTLQLVQKDYNLNKEFDLNRVKISRDYQDIPAVRCAPSKIQQVFFNILRNAMQAFVGSDQELNPELSLRLYQHNDRAVIEIGDNGPGMDEATRKRIFEPFYTTKEVGQGTGLGLSVSYFIVTENHYGTMRVESVKNKGSKFIIELPIDPEIDTSGSI